MQRDPRKGPDTSATRPIGPSEGATLPGSTLPSRPTPFVGRAEELADLHRTLLDSNCRLVTIVGPPGVGKTRLAVESAAELAREFPDAVLFVDLTPVRDPALVVFALAESLGMGGVWETRAAIDLPVMEAVKDALRERSILLLLDNFEHVVEAAPALGELLGACPGLKVLATSRVPLHIQWERQYPLSPLAVPDLERLPDLETLAQVPAVAMFSTRARAFAPAFALTIENARTVADICVRLDGLPLAIELIVARVKTLPLPTILDQLAHRLQFLTGGARDLPPRQQTLRSAIAWSYDLLTTDEQVLFRRLAIFAGGCDVAAVTAVCPDPGGQSRTLDLLDSIVDKNLLLWMPLPDGTGRYRMLESLREFGLEQLAVRGEAAAMHARHAAYFLSLAEEAEPQLMGPDEDRWHDRLERDHDNLRLALGWALGGGDPELGARMAGALRRFWNIRGHWSEGRMWVQQALAAGASVSPATRAKALYTGGVLASLQDDDEDAVPMIEECLAVRQTLGDRPGIAEAIWFLGTLIQDPARRVHLLEESLALSREIHDKRGIVTALSSLGPAIHDQGDLVRAKALLQETLVLAREVGEYRAITSALRGLGWMALEEGDVRAARAVFMEALEAARRHGDKLRIIHLLLALADVAWRESDLARAGTFLGDSLALVKEMRHRGWTARIHRLLGRLALRGGDRKRAATLIEDSLQLNRDVGDRAGVARSLEAAADVIADTGRREQARRLLMAAARLRAGGGVRPYTAEEMQLERPLFPLDVLPEDTSEPSPSTDAGDSVEEILDAATAILRSISGRAGSEPPSPTKRAGGLTARESEVAVLVARGLSNRQIAERLFISERTADSHLEHILTKLGMTSRAQIAAWAVRHGLDDLGGDKSGAPN